MAKMSNFYSIYVVIKCQNSEMFTKILNIPVKYSIPEIRSQAKYVFRILGISNYNI